jgi:hypothetical protein
MWPERKSNFTRKKADSKYVNGALVIVQRKPSALEFLPVQVLLTLPMLFHGDTILNRANQFAEITAHTFLFFN